MELSANWKKLKARLDTEASTQQAHKTSKVVTESRKRRPTANLGAPAKKTKLVRASMADSVRKSEIGTADAPKKSEDDNADQINQGLSNGVEIGKYVAIDCEMVGVGPDPGRGSALARVTIVNYNGEQVYDSFVRPKEVVTDWRTHVSGISPKNMEGARSLEEVQAHVVSIIQGKVLIGHAIRNDLDALLLGHPRRDIRDTARHPAFRKFAGGGSPRLKVLAAEILGLEIQDGAHSSLQDARATMLLFRKEKDSFEREHAKKWSPAESNAQKKTSKKKKKKKKA